MASISERVLIFVREKVSIKRQIDERLDPLRLSGRVQHYPWGKVGAESRIAPFISGQSVDSPLAEYWIGAHPKSPSLATLSDGSSVALPDLIASNPEGILGKPCLDRFGARLPFMVKVLSVSGDFGLSIQLHPTKEKARALHRLAPQHYPDDEHKPEVGVALTPVTLLYGTKSIAEVRTVLEKLAPLRNALPEEVRRALSQSKPSLGDDVLVKQVFVALLTLSDEQVRGVVRGLRAITDPSVAADAGYQIFLRLSTRYGDGDRGLPLIPLMNLVRLEPGQGIFIGSNIPHAYLEGDLFECMACSDNVVRGGLTPKFIDLPTLVEVVDCSSPSERILTPRSEGERGFLYPTPTAEFQVRVCSPSSKMISLSTSGTPVVLLCLGESAMVSGVGSGAVRQLGDGGALLLPANSGDYQVAVERAQVFCVTLGEV